LPEENELPLQRKGDALTGDAHQEIWHEGFQVCEA
jgi:hypothetical protein